MPSINHTRILGITQKQAQRDIKAMFQRMVDELNAVILRYADNDGIVPFEQLRRVRTAIAPVIMRYFVGVDGRNAYDDNNRPLSPFANILNRHLATVQGQVVLAHTRWLHKRLPDDLLNWMRQGRNPIQEQFDPNPLAEFEHTHRWLDSRGYNLSDRIWGVGTETRRKIDLLLTDHIRNGNSAVNIARRLEQYLLPGRAAVRTNKPYGRDGSFDAMRLARSEITYAHGKAAKVAAGMNPFVTTMTWNLSPQHPKIDICDDLAAKSPYPIKDCPVPMGDSHPHCLCYLTSDVTSSPSSVINDLYEEMNNGQTALLNPSNPRSFLKDILEEVLFSVFMQSLTRDELDLFDLATDVYLGARINRIES